MRQLKGHLYQRSESLMRNAGGFALVSDAFGHPFFGGNLALAHLWPGP